MKLQTVLLLVSSLAFAACAGQTYRASVGPMFIRPKGELALQNAGDTLVLANNQNSLGGNLGLDDTDVAPYIRGRTDIGPHRVRLDALFVDADGAGTLAGDYGGIPAGSQVTTSMDFFAISSSYGYEVLRNEHYRIALGGKLGFYALDTSARSTIGRESVQTDVIVPMPYAEAEAFLGPVTVGASFAMMSADLGDANGRYWDFEGYGKWQAYEDLDLMVGYRYLLLDGYGRASGRDFDADVDLQGIFITAGIRF